MLDVCYKCHKLVGCLSPRSRCVRCEYESNRFNELKNNQLRQELHMLNMKLQRLEDNGE